MINRLVYTVVVCLLWATTMGYGQWFYYQYHQYPVSEGIPILYKYASFLEVKELPRFNGVCPQIIGNLVNDFPLCLISIYNNHHLEVGSTEVPVLQKRFAPVQMGNTRLHPDDSYLAIRYNGKPANISSLTWKSAAENQDDLYMKSKWTCSIGVSVCNTEIQGFMEEPFPGRKFIGETSPQIPGTVFKGWTHGEYPTLFPRSKVTLPTLWFVVLKVDSEIVEGRDLNSYSFIRGTSRIVVLTKTNKDTSGSTTRYFGIRMYEKTLRKQLIEINPDWKGLTIQEITKQIYYPPNTIQIISSPHYTRERLLKTGKPVSKIITPAEYKDAKQILALSQTISDHKMIQFMRPSILESIDLFADGILAQAVSPNISKILGYESNHPLDTPIIRVQVRETNFQLAFVTTAEEFRFLSCGKPEKSRIDFVVYVSPFDLSTWMILLTANFILSVIITINNHQSVSTGVLRGLVILVEQGDSAAVNTKRIPFLYWICGPWILITLIMTNAYKGENITKLLAPYKSIPYENFSQLVNHDFRIFSESKEIQHPEQSHSYWVGPYFRFLMSGMINWNKDYSPQWKKNVQQILKGEMHSVSFHESRKELITCKKLAYVGWTSETTQLYEEISLLFPEYKDEKLYIGKEVLAKQNRGWEIDFLNDESFYRKLSTLQESGIAQRLNTLLSNAKRFHNINVLNATSKFQIKVKGISIKGNVFTIFLLVSGLFSFVLVILAVEILINCFIVQIFPKLVILMRRCRSEFLTFLLKHKFI